MSADRSRKLLDMLDVSTTLIERDRRMPLVVLTVKVDGEVKTATTIDPLDRVDEWPGPGFDLLDLLAGGGVDDG